MSYNIRESLTSRRPACGAETVTQVCEPGFKLTVLLAMTLWFGRPLKAIYSCSFGNGTKSSERFCGLYRMGTKVPPASFIIRFLGRVPPTCASRKAQRRTTSFSSLSATLNFTTADRDSKSTERLRIPGTDAGRLQASLTLI